MGKRKSVPVGYTIGGVTLGSQDGQAVARWRDEASGKWRRVKLGVSSKNKAEARAALERFADARRVVVAVHSQPTVGELWQKWLAEREQDGFNNEIYEHQWKALRAHFENRDPTVLAVQDFRDYARARFSLGRAPSTVNTELRRLHACLKWAHESHLIDRRPKPWAPSPGEGRQRELTMDEARALMDAATQSAPHIFLFVVLLFATGARHRAIVDLTWDRVDFEAGTISYDEDLPRDPMSKSWRKGRATVPMNRAARAALEVAFAGRQSDYVIEHGGRRVRECREGFRAAVERAGLWNPDDRITPHVIRHTVATWLDRKNVETRRTAQLLGHRDERTTKRVYTHAKADVLIEAVEALDFDFAPLPKSSHSEAAESGEIVGDGT